MKILIARSRAPVLLVAGALLVIVAASILVFPGEFYAANDIRAGVSASLLNELKAPAGFLLVAGLYVIAAIFVARFTDAALALAAAIYLSYAGSRFASMLFDGVPAEGLVQAALLEAVVGLACLAVALVRRPGIARMTWCW